MADLNFTQGTVTDGGGTHPAVNPTNANDGDDGTYTLRNSFAAGGGVYTVIWESDLGSAETVDAMDFRHVGSAVFMPTLAAVPSGPTGSYSEGAAIAWSDDGSAWTDFTGDVSEAVAGNPVMTHWTFSALTHRYWRVTLWSSASVPTFHRALGFATWAITEGEPAPPDADPLAGLYFDAYEVDR